MITPRSKPLCYLPQKPPENGLIRRRSSPPARRPSLHELRIAPNDDLLRTIAPRGSSFSRWRTEPLQPLLSNLLESSDSSTSPSLTDYKAARVCNPKFERQEPLNKPLNYPQNEETLITAGSPFKATKSAPDSSGFGLPKQSRKVSCKSRKPRFTTKLLVVSPR